MGESVILHSGHGCKKCMSLISFRRIMIYMQIRKRALLLKFDNCCSLIVCNLKKYVQNSGVLMWLVFLTEVACREKFNNTPYFSMRTNAVKIYYGYWTLENERWACRREGWHNLTMSLASWELTAFYCCYGYPQQVAKWRWFRHQQRIREAEFRQGPDGAESHSAAETEKGGDEQEGWWVFCRCKYKWFAPLLPCWQGQVFQLAKNVFAACVKTVPQV